MTHSIAFPKLGLSFDINRVAFNIFGKEIFWYAIIIAFAFLCGLLFVAWSAKKQKIDTDTIYDIAIGGLIFGIIGARLYYIMFDFDSVRGSFFNIFKVWEGGIAIYGGIIGAGLFAYFYCKRKKLPTLKIFDVCAAGLLIGQFIGRWGNFVNAEVYGNITNSIFGMSINGAPPVHPLFLYELLWNLLGFILILLFAKYKKSDGQIFFSYILYYSVGRLFLEGMRQSEYILYLIKPDNGLFPFSVGISQVVAFLAIISSVTVLIYLSKKYKIRQHS